MVPGTLVAEPGSVCCCTSMTTTTMLQHAKALLMGSSTRWMGGASRRLANAASMGYFRAENCRVDDLAACCHSETAKCPSDFTARGAFHTAIQDEIVIYDSSTLPWDDDVALRQCEASVAEVLMHGSGVVVFRGAVEHATVDAASSVFWALIAEQGGGSDRGDHFARAGANSRLWNAVEKLAVRAPSLFVEYYANPTIALASRAWLGPGYQLSAQVNVVHPGGEAQAPHRDYHLGFRSNGEAEQYPAHVHTMCPTLTLQGAIAHSDMPAATGPTLFLPHSQKYAQGYLAWRSDEFKAYFADNCVQLPLRKGDAVFFNPAVFHAAGSNSTADVDRMANLLQINSSFGRCMESIDRSRMSKAIYPALLAAATAGQGGGMGPAMLSNAIAAAAEANPFPTNLDSDPPVGGLAPESQAAILTRCLEEKLSVEEMEQCLDEHQCRVRSHHVK